MHKQRGFAAPEASAGVTTFCPKLGAEICRRVAAGESVQAICAAPGMPWPSTLWSWTRARPEFAAELRAARRSARLARRVADKLAAAERAAKRGARASGRRCGYTAEIGEEICTRLTEGESLIAICRDPDMPSTTAVYDWLDRHEDFEAMYIRARERQADYLFDEAREVALAATPQTVWADRLRFDIPLAGGADRAAQVLRAGGGAVRRPGGAGRGGRPPRPDRHRAVHEGAERRAAGRAAAQRGRGGRLAARLRPPLRRAAGAGGGAAVTMLPLWASSAEGGEGLRSDGGGSF
jgi:hypothetical protein